MLVTFNRNGFNLVTTETSSVRIKTPEENFDEILSLFLDLSDKEKKKIRRVRFE